MLKELAPILIPSWRFFDRVSDSLQIEFAWVPSPTIMDQESLWQVFRPKPEHLGWGQSLLQLFWNPAGNELMYLLSCADKVLADDSVFAMNEIEQRLRKTCPPLTSQSYLMFRLRVGNQISFVSEPRSGATP